jgi:hypothetical protein
MANVSGMELYIDVGSASPSLPTWWQFKNPSSCRNTSLQMSLSPPLGSTCTDWAPALAIGGIGAYSVGGHGPNTSRLSAAIAVAPSDLRTLDPGREYFLATFTINHARTVGTGACAGCDVPVCIFLSRVRVTTPDVTSDLFLNFGANNMASQFVTWQNGTPVEIGLGCDPPPETCVNKYVTFTCVPNSATPARGSTWGAVKSLYR